MTKVLMLVLITHSYTLATAQNGFSVMGGINFTSSTPSGLNGYYIPGGPERFLRFKYFPGAFIGAAYTKALSNDISVSGGLAINHSVAGTKIYVNDKFEQWSSIRRTMLDLQLLLNCFTDKKVSVSFGLSGEVVMDFSSRNRDALGDFGIYTRSTGLYDGLPVAYLSSLYQVKYKLNENLRIGLNFKRSKVTDADFLAGPFSLDSRRWIQFGLFLQKKI